MHGLEAGGDPDERALLECGDGRLVRRDQATEVAAARALGLERAQQPVLGGAGVECRHDAIVAVGDLVGRDGSPGGSAGEALEGQGPANQGSAS
ncbi:MAG: hypothetical protein U5R31_04055 [Acidimicrobiia bacterium]|nr:hypothetical protein [Acidimicrobiia bacterium]